MTLNADINQEVKTNIIETIEGYEKKIIQTRFAKNHEGIEDILRDYADYNTSQSFESTIKNIMNEMLK